MSRMVEAQPSVATHVLFANRGPMIGFDYVNQTRGIIERGRATQRKTWE